MFRELCNILAGAPPLQREGESNLAREKEDPEAEMNRQLRVAIVVHVRTRYSTFGSALTYYKPT